MLVRPSIEGQRGEKEDTEVRPEPKNIDIQWLRCLENRRSKPNNMRILQYPSALSKKPHHGEP